MNPPSGLARAVPPPPSEKATSAARAGDPAPDAPPVTHLEQPAAADGGSPAEKLARSWRECHELREQLEAREEAERRATEEVTDLRARQADLRLALDGIERGLVAWRTEARAERERLEGELSAERAELASLERQLEKRRAVEGDLRAMLASERRQTAAARLQVDTLCTRLADMPAVGGGANDGTAGQELAATGGGACAKPAEWSAMDDELLKRLAKAGTLRAPDARVQPV